MLTPQDLARQSDKDEKRKNRDNYSNNNYQNKNILSPFDELSGIRIPPQDLETEKALLGSLLLVPDAFYDIGNILDRNDFYSEKHRIIFETIHELINKKEPVDLLTVSAKLRERKELEQIGGTDYLSSLLGLVGSAANVVYYANIVKKKSVLRKLIIAGGHIGEMAFNEEKELEHVLEEAERKIYEITSKNSGDSDVVSMRDLGDETISRFIHLAENQNEVRGVPSGFRDLDNKLAGFQKSDLIILAARPSVGKTSFALDIARNAAVKSNVPTVVFSLEMSKQQLVDRMLSAEAQVDGWKLRTGKLSMDDEIERLQEGMHKLMQAPIFIDDKPSNTVMNMRSVLRKLNHDKPVGLVIVDYLQLMGTSRTYDNMVNQVTEISRSLKGLAKEFNVPVIALSQLSRAVESRGGRPRLSDLRDSGSIEQDADIVMLIHREDKYDKDSDKKNVIEILIEKHRNGPTGIVELFFDSKKTSFLSIDKNEFGDFEMPKVDTFDEF
ncbi:MAG: replicative DNA helicase [Candidatus Pacebacteria bacterium]|nr:replicative DNA helicase [Candidatus Paceibacterota bacterium]